MAGIDKYHPVCVEFLKRASARVEDLKDKLCDPTLDDKTTTTIRGQIAALREVISWPEQEEPNYVPPVDFGC